VWNTPFFPEIGAFHAPYKWQTVPLPGIGAEMTIANHLCLAVSILGISCSGCIPDRDVNRNHTNTTASPASSNTTLVPWRSNSNTTQATPRLRPPRDQSITLEQLLDELRIIRASVESIERKIEIYAGQETIRRQQDLDNHARQLQQAIEDRQFELQQLEEALEATRGK
jgi:hypothetical protein